MPGTLLHQGALVQCAHMGTAQPSLVNPRVKVMGQALVTQPPPWNIAGCTLPTPPAANGPCVTALWATGALRVKALGLPVLLMDSMATCAPTGTPLTVKLTQQRVKGM